MSEVHVLLCQLFSCCILQGDCQDVLPRIEGRYIVQIDCGQRGAGQRGNTHGTAAFLQDVTIEGQ